MLKSLDELDGLKSRWLSNDQSFELLAPGFEEYFEGLQRFKEIHNTPRWESFVEAIRGSAVFAKVFTAAMHPATKDAISVPFLFLTASLKPPQSVSDLSFGLMGVDSVLDESDREFIREKMRENRIDPNDFITLKQVSP